MTLTQPIAPLSPSSHPINSLNETIEQTQQMIALDAQQPLWVYRQLGESLIQQNQIEQGIKVLRQAIALYPDKAGGFAALGGALIKQGDLKNAIAHYQRAIALDVHQPLWVYRQLGDSLVQQGQIKQGIQFLRQAIALYPDKAVGYTALAVALVQNGSIQEAIRHYQKAIELTPNPPEWLKKELEDCQNIAVVKGVKLLINSEEISAKLRNIISEGRYESQEAKILEKVLKPTDNVLEIGGGIGFLSIYVKKKFPDIHISSYEANPKLIEVIKQNQQLNHCELPIHNVILDDQDGEVDFFVAKDFWASSTVMQYQGAYAIKVKKTNINRAIAAQGANFLIMDIEGGEADLVPKISYETIDKILMEIHPQIIGHAGLSRVFKTLLNHGFLYDTANSIGHVYFFYKENA